ncbi:MAG: phosphate ABC transporter substrate-binding protein [Chloroflexota bacterium]
MYASKGKYLVITAVLALISIFVVACGGGTSEGSATSGNLTIAGSSALLPLVQEAATQYQTAHPDVTIAVSAGGSGAGRSQVCAGDINIGNSDVPISEEEKQELNCQDAVMTSIAQQAFVMAANPTGPAAVNDLTKQQLQDIFSCKITNWSEVGGDDQAIVVVNRTQGSGTRATMANYLYGGDDAQFCVGASEESNNETAYQTTAQTPGAITYLGLAYGEQAGIVVFGIDGIEPPLEGLTGDNNWPITGPGYSITKGEPTGLAAAFLDFVTSNEFQNQSVLVDLGYLPIPADQRSN